MRLNHWLATMAGILAMACGIPAAVAQTELFNAPPTSSVHSEIGPISVRAQSPTGYSPQYAPGGHVVPGGYAVPGGAMGADPNYCPVEPSQVYAAGPPPGMQPWPQITPFEHRYSEHRNEGGLWTLRNNDAARKYFFGLGGMFFRLAKPENGIFGDRDVAAAQGLTDKPGVNARNFIPIGTRNFAGDSVFHDDFTTVGVRTYWGYWDPDDTGLELVGWWASQVTEDFDAFENFNLPTPPPFTARGYAVPVNNGQLNGTVLFFDGSHSLRYRMIAANGQITRMARTIWEWNDTIRVRPTYGARYTFLREGMFFQGFNYSATVNPYETFLNNDVSTHLAGPEVGLNAAIGGGFLKVTLGSKFILYVNHERQRLEGRNFIDIGTLSAPVPVPVPLPLPFHDTRFTTHVSPAFEQTVHIEIKAFDLIPWLNRMDFFKNAKLRGGLTYLDIGEITRPSESVRYNGFPFYPRLKTERSKFSMLGWDAGLHFEY